MHMYSIANKLLAPESLSHMQEAQHSNRSIVRLLSSLEAFSQTLHSNELDNNFILNHFAVSIVNMPDGRRQPIVGFAFGSPSALHSSVSSRTVLLIRLEQQSNIAHWIDAHQQSFNGDQTRLASRSETESSGLLGLRSSHRPVRSEAVPHPNTGALLDSGQASAHTESSSIREH